ncbi:MAG TPA: glycosyltransferase family 2 protein [Gemmataceae bacterium]|jgi:glycosyltransferase involved in cell wall biosynthesis|nr:glycosyltransferase family 2 protein [Gemmataceae bacterium]
MPESSLEPAVSIILPTYNRARFLPQALASIRSQTWTDWELIIVDDGSTDNTRELVEGLTRGWQQRVRYHCQENQGAYGARNTGLDLACGQYIAFFDSDDVWLSHHLGDCVTALEANADVDWVYGACRVVDNATNRTLADNTFYEGSLPRAFLKLHSRTSGRLRIIDDPNAIRCRINHGLMAGLQNSVIRSRLFDSARFQTTYRNEAEDQLFGLRAMLGGARFAYYDAVHVIYHVHEGNSSAATGAGFERLLRVQQELIHGFEDARKRLKMGLSNRRAFDHRLSREYFWVLGYSIYWQHGQRNNALSMFWRGLKLWPWSLRYWKTYLGAQFRTWANWS